MSRIIEDRSAIPYNFSLARVLNYSGVNNYMASTSETLTEATHLMRALAADPKHRLPAKLGTYAITATGSHKAPAIQINGHPNLVGLEVQTIEHEPTVTVLVRKLVLSRAGFQARFATHSRLVEGEGKLADREVDKVISGGRKQAVASIIGLSPINERQGAVCIEHSVQDRGVTIRSKGANIEVDPGNGQYLRLVPAFSHKQEGLQELLALHERSQRRRRS